MALVGDNFNDTTCPTTEESTNTGEEGYHHEGNNVEGGEANESENKPEIIVNKPEIVSGGKPIEMTHGRGDIQGGKPGLEVKGTVGSGKPEETAAEKAIREAKEKAARDAKI